MFKSILLRMVLPLAITAAILAWLTMPLIDRSLTAWFRSDLELRAALVFNSVADRISELIATGSVDQVGTYLAKVTTDERLRAIVVCSSDGTVLASAGPIPADLGCRSAKGPPVGDSVELGTSNGTILVSRFQTVPAAAKPVDIMVLHDLNFAASRATLAGQYVLSISLVAIVLISMLVVVVVWLTLRKWAALLVGDIRSRRFLDDARSPAMSVPVLSQVRKVLSEIEARQRLEIEYQENWTPQALRQVVHDQLGAPEMLVVSNREPYIHAYGPAGAVEVQTPASGMVTALEPIVRACAGTWVAHGSGSADRLVVDRRDHVRVPPEDPAYTLRRVWLDEREEDGYYYGFSNEGLWPLCHLAYVRPEFREVDWQIYQSVNEKFADAVATECATLDPVVLIQDYHFALLPKLIRARKPGATIAVFWHIPWPSAETFGVCPWKADILHHLLAADILGFHTRYHCQNFLATVDRFIECQIDHERMTVTVRGHTCQVTAYPISIEWPPRWLSRVADAPSCRRVVREKFGIPAGAALALGVERWDFTKGILERFRAIEVLLERNPRYRDKFCFLQIAAPSRSRLPAYRDLQERTIAEAERVNARFAEGSWRPIVLVAEHQEPEQVFELFRAADVCLVNSLHDGMNLVAKEFVAARDDEDGVLVLSTFAGASRELLESLLVNPFDVSETASALEVALQMPREERRQRMRLMRQTVKENNIYRWAGRMLTDAARIRQRQRLALAPGSRPALKLE
ncbi:MAG: trehalose-6-phosphate synthase [Steroidobacteraceae bacterium]|nr:trehalose-6-phosphate synthase [Steroidobacteraceae bacterium]